MWIEQCSAFWDRDASSVLLFCFLGFVSLLTDGFIIEAGRGGRTISCWREIRREGGIYAAWRKVTMMVCATAIASAAFYLESMCDALRASCNDEQSTSNEMKMRKLDQGQVKLKFL